MPGDAADVHGDWDREGALGLDLADLVCFFAGWYTPPKEDG